MKKMGIDQTSAWLFAIILTCASFASIYLLLDMLATDPSQRMVEEIAMMEATDDEESSEPEKLEKEDASSQEPQQAPVKSSQSMGGITPWSYRGKSGPDFWGSLSDDYMDCQIGREQSPIDINNPIRTGELKNLIFRYKASSVDIVNDGHSISGSFNPGNYLEYQGASFSLVSFSLHLPSEHTVDGIPFDMELQLVHQGDNGKSLNLGIFIEEGNRPNKYLAPVWKRMPKKAQQSGGEVTLDLMKLLPKNRKYYAYQGSQTTPPCREGVEWLLLVQAIKVSSKQIDEFIEIYRNNSRPIQGINKRSVFVSSNR
ncbi:MAG: carbonic anhydrase family protein [Oligoflexales bacterium]|nr:carbonic anhydrase family protein [Oligoflexales bacterium]